jgi:hypothetical protein
MPGVLGPSIVTTAMAAADRNSRMTFSWTPINASYRPLPGRGKPIF